MSVSAGMGKSIPVTNLSDPVRLVLPVIGVMPPAKTFKAYCTLMQDVHLVTSEVNESVLILKIKPNLQPNNTNITGDVGIFTFMNKGTAVYYTVESVKKNCSMMPSLR